LFITERLFERTQEAEARMVTDQQVRKYLKLKKTEDGKGRKGRKA
jgi:hypothetical protein